MLIAFEQSEKVSSPAYEDMVEDLGADGPDDALGESVGLWCTYRRLDDPGSFGAEHLVEGGGELRVAVTDQEARVLQGSLLLGGYVGSRPR